MTQIYFHTFHNPSLVDPCWIGRKHYAAINTQVAVDHNGLITDIVARWSGGTHEGFVWANSAVRQKAGRGEFGRSIFLGDSGYPLRKLPRDTDNQPSNTTGGEVQ